jgi:hypothetical protein
MKSLKKHLTVSLVCLSFALPTFAHNNPHKDYKNQTPAGWWSPSRLYMGAYGSYGVIDGGYQHDGQASQGRLSLGLRAAEFNCLSFGLEAGVQSGNDMRLTASTALIDATGGLPIQATLKPFLDLLVTVKAHLLEDHPLFGILKGGIAYRQLQLVDRSSAQGDLQRVNGEVQAGLGYNITDHAMLTAFYQGIYAGGSAGVGLNAAGDVTLSRIPTQQAGFLGLEYSL